ncbi:TonB-dependent receptor plug domain-containing protein [Arcticibacter sp.]|uniref:TonB-dependent receptor plug domain-containing protein n=1 Tax=Arcticibacter sp. TaxID=1872630 RepID=UPI00388F0930
MITVSGFLIDASNGETLGGALVSSASTTIAANTYGYYSISVPPHTKSLKYSCLGYVPLELSLQSAQDTVINVSLSMQSNMISEVVINVSGHTASDKTAKSLSMGAVKLLPSFLGEADLIKSFQLLPGVTTIGDGASGFNVRGGGVDQNLVLLDEAPLYFTSHLFNLFSVANPDAVMDAVLYKSEMPARYGGRLSSVLDTRLRDGNNQQWQATGGIGLIASRLTLEGPLKKNKSAVLISARRSYTDVITRQSSNADIKDNSIYFYDLNTKINFPIGEKNRIFISGYLGKDKIQSAEDFLLQWGTGTGTLRWNHVFNNKLFSNLSLIFSDYRYSLGSMSEPTSSFLWKASIRDYTAKNVYYWYAAPGNTVNFGAETALHIFSPGSAMPEGPASIFQPVRLHGQRSADYSLFWNHELKPADRLSIEYGARYTGFQSIATDSTVIYDYEGEKGSRRYPVNQRQYDDGTTIKWYHSLQPRLSIRLRTGESSTWKASYTRTVQNLHLISNSLSTSPLDMWTPSSYNIKPERATQFSIGFSNSPFSAPYKFTAEAYYRKLSNQLDFVDGAETLLNEHLPGDILVGKGRAYGTELQMEKTSGDLTGWISYTLSRTERKIDGINSNRYYPAKYDKTHALAAVAMYRLSSRILLSATYSAASGTPATLPSSRYEFSGYTVLYNPGNARNNYRIPSYHRLDLSATFRNKIKPGKKMSSEWVLSAFNALNRRNAFSMYLRQKENNPLNLEAVQYSMLGMIVPSVTWNFKF